MLGGQKVLWLQGSQRMSRACYFLENLLDTLDGDLGCARYGACDVQFVSVIPWLDSDKG